MRILVIGDIHLHNQIPGCLEAQVDAIKRMVDESAPTEHIIFLGDIFVRRRPAPRTLLAFMGILEYCTTKDIEVHVIRGNHDAESKADDGVTVLQVFENMHNVHIYNHMSGKNIEGHQFHFLPHYENEETVRACLSEINDGILFAHVGFDGCLNAAGDYDFNIPPSEFKVPTFLGHIHKFAKKDNITVLGTPYTTGFYESGKDSYYMVLDYGDENIPNVEFIKTNFGIRHVTLGLEELHLHKEDLEDPNYFTLLRVFLRPLDEGNTPELIKDIINDYGVRWVDLKFRSVIHQKDELSNYESDVPLFQLNEVIIEDFVREHGTHLPYEAIMAGLKELE